MAAATEARNHRPSKPPKVLIVGAGISGLKCADELLQSGFDVTIWEARDRVGGRMHQSVLSTGQSVDLGPNWIHGTIHNPILDIAKQTNTLTYDWETFGHAFDEDGDLLTDAQQLNEEVWGLILEAFRHSSTLSDEIDAETSLYDFFVRRTREANLLVQNPRRHQKIIRQMAAFWGGFVGSPVTRQSLKFFWLEECIEGENLFCASTYERVLGRIAEPVLNSAALRLSTKAVQFGNVGSKLRVKTANQLEEEFDEVVVTSPLGWLKNNQAAFTPSLPDRFSQAVDNIGYGSLEKVYITFPEAFWIDKNAAPKDLFTGFTQFLSPSYATDTNPDRWFQQCVDLSTLPKDCAHPTLLFYIFGDQSVTLASDLQALSSEQEKSEHIKEFFKPYFSLLPNYRDDATECHPIACLATTWVLDELAGFGSYSTFRTGLQQGDKDIEVMRAGLPERGLWFAGEHTAPFNELGTVTGAYSSGAAVARRIAEAYGIIGVTDRARENAPTR